MYIKSIYQNETSVKITIANQCTGNEITCFRFIFDEKGQANQNRIYF